MNSEDPSPPFFPWELVVGTSDHGTPEQQCKQRQELEGLGWTGADEGDWLAHAASGWLCNPMERIFYHAERNLLVPANVAESAREVTEGVKAAAISGEPQETESPDGLETLSHQYEDDLAESDDESDLMLDLEDELEAATVQKKASRNRHG